MLALTGEISNLLHHLPTADNRIGFTIEELLKPYMSNDEPCCFVGGVLMFWKYPKKSWGETHHQPTLQGCY